MSTEEDIDLLIGQGRLCEWVIEPDYPDDPTVRHRRLIMTPEAYAEVTYDSAKRRVLSGNAFGYAQEACNDFVGRDAVGALLYPEGETVRWLDPISSPYHTERIDEVWELRSNLCGRKDKARLLGWFPVCGIFLGTAWYRRAQLGQKGSPAWEKAMARVHKARLNDFGGMPTVYPAYDAVRVLTYQAPSIGGRIWEN